MKAGMLVVCWTDDLVTVFKDPTEAQRFAEKMQEYGNSTCQQSSSTSFLGMNVERNNRNGTITLTQPGLIAEILQTPSMEIRRQEWRAPADMQHLVSNQKSPPMTEAWSYSDVIGKLLQLSINTRPDIAFAVNQVSRFIHAPKQAHASAVKNIVRYLKGTNDKGTILKPDGTLNLLATPAVNTTVTPSGVKSHTGYLVSLGNCPILWKSQTDTSVKMATTMSQYYASLSSCLPALVHIKQVLEEIVSHLEVPVEVTASIRADCTVTPDTFQQPATVQRPSNRSRYYQLQKHRFWTALRDGDVKVSKSETSLKDGDYFTKPLPRQTFEANRLRVQGW
jgi:hypothetical protein